MYGIKNIKHSQIQATKTDNF